MFKKKEGTAAVYNQRMRSIIHKIMAQVPDTSLTGKDPLFMTIMKKGTVELSMILLDDSQIVYKISLSDKPSFHSKPNLKDSNWKIGPVHAIMDEFKNYSN